MDVASRRTARAGLPGAFALLLVAVPGALSVGCDSTGEAGGAGGQSRTSSTSASASTTSGTTATSSSSPTGSSTSTGGPSAPTAAELLALTADCITASAGKYATDEGESETIDLCALTGAYFWKSDFDVDCDGKQSTECNIGTDPAYQDQTSATDSEGDPLDAASLPFIVIPLPSSRFDYGDADIHLGAVAAVVYQDKVVYAVFGDEGPSDIIGEGSYALAEALGIDPDPSTGGSDGPVTFFVFSGTSAVVVPIEDRAAATAKGEAMAKALLAAP